MPTYGEESHRFTYDVFLSFRGEDTRHSFIGHLRKDLQRKGINAFFDDKSLRIGEGISLALSKAIQESKISVIVFSETYASSTWCLAELVEILECSKGNRRQLAFPIFYHVNPSDVRHQRNGYGDAMAAHENRFGKDSEKIQAWRSALSEVANLKGHHIHTGFEIDHIEKIVEEVYANIAPKPLHVGEDPVGLEDCTEEVKSLLDLKPRDDTVCMLGIHGLGGVGKTELAKALYNKIVHRFEAASFLGNVREKSSKINGLEDLQKTLLSEMLEELETELGCTSKGIYEIKRKLGKKKILLVLDDVDDRKQLNNLAGGCNWFGPGSRIIITTRDKDVLIGHQVQEIYKVNELNDQHSLELFCQNAFGRSHPETGYEDTSSRAVGYAKGLPLALKVIGSNLATTENSVEAWEDALKEYERSPPKSIQDMLKISYNQLGHDARTVFLDIACFFKGERIEHVKKILQEFGATSNIRELVNKSLLTVEDSCLNMHDLIQDMGREIVRQEARNLGKRSRLWFYEDVLEVLTEDSGSDAIEGIILDPPQREVIEWSGTAFEEMKQLRILIVRNTIFSSEPKHLPNHLRLLDWEEYPSKFLPQKFHPKKIVVINMTKSQLTMEEPFKKFACLTDMNFSRNQSITAMPDVSEVQNLRELRLDNCKNLTMVHESVGFLKYLSHLSASGCPKLRNFLQRMFLPSLEVLDLNLCVKLEHFPDIVNNMNKPLKIYMINTAIEELPDSIGNLTGLVSIEIPSSRKLKYLPSSLFMLPNVVAFKIGGCSQLRESFRRFLHGPSSADSSRTLKTLYFGNGGLSDEDLHAILICFPKLEELIAYENNFVSLPECIKESTHLTNLDVSVCKELQEIPECTNLSILNVHQCVKLEHISELPSTTQKVDARYCFSLTRETSDMLWYQASKEIRGLEIVMPKTEVPEWFDYTCNGGNPRFWARGKFPTVALALVFEDVSERARPSRRLLAELHLVINGQCVPHKGYYSFRIAPDHVLVCDLRLLFSEEEQLGLDALLEHEWNQVQISYEAPSTTTLSCWGVFVYKQGTNMKDVQFMCPDPKYSSDIANNIIPTIVPTKDPKQELKKMIDASCLDIMFDGMLMETIDYEKRDHFADFADKAFAEEQFHVLMSGVKEISTQAKDVLEGKAPLDGSKNSTLAGLLEAMKKLDDEKNEPVVYHNDLALIRVKDGIKPPVAIRQVPTSGQQRSLEVQGCDPEQEIVMEIFLDGMGAGLREAQSSFPSLDIDTTMVSALNKDNMVRLAMPESEVEMKVYMEGIINGLLEAKLSFPTLDEWAILNTVLSKGGHKVVFQALDWTKVKVPSSDDLLLEAFMMMKQENCESETKSKLFCKWMEEHKALRKKFEQLENESSAPDKDRCLLPPSKNQYDEILEKLNTQFSEFISKKGHSLDGTDDDQALESTISESKSALSSTKMHTDIGKEGCKGVAKYEKLGAVLKGRAEELRRLYDAGVESFQNSEDIQDLMSAIYLNGLRDGLLEAQVILLALDMDTSTTPVFEENEEHVTHETAKDEHVTAVATDNENPHETTGHQDIPTPSGPEVDNPRDTSKPSGSEVLVNMDDFGYMFS